MGISKTMQNYCGEIKYDELLKSGLKRLRKYEQEIVPNTFAYNPHELTRLLEVFDILTVSQLIIQACISRKKNSPSLCFIKGTTEFIETEKDKKLIVIKQLGKRLYSLKNRLISSGI